MSKQIEFEYYDQDDMDQSGFNAISFPHFKECEFWFSGPSVTMKEDKIKELIKFLSESIGETVPVKVKIFSVISDNGDGSSSVEYYLDEEYANSLVESEDGCYYPNEGCYSTIETYIGSDLYNKAD